MKKICLFLIAIATAFTACQNESVIDNPSPTPTAAPQVQRIPAAGTIYVSDWEVVYQYSVWGANHGDMDVKLSGALSAKFTGEYTIALNMCAVKLTNGGWLVFRTAGPKCSAVMTSVAPTGGATTIIRIIIIDPSSGYAVFEIISTGEIITFYDSSWDI